MIVADRWGEIAYVFSSEDDRPAAVPDPDELLEWVNF